MFASTIILFLDAAENKKKYEKYSKCLLVFSIIAALVAVIAIAIASWALVSLSTAEQVSVTHCKQTKNAQIEQQFFRE